MDETTLMLTCHFKSQKKSYLVFKAFFFQAKMLQIASINLTAGLMEWLGRAMVLGIFRCCLGLLKALLSQKLKFPLGTASFISILHTSE